MAPLPVLPDFRPLEPAALQVRLLFFCCTISLLVTDYRTDAPPILRDFLVYHETIQGHSRRTVDEYFLDLRNFFRFLKLDKGRVARNTPLDQISIDDVDLDLVGSVTLSDVYSYMNYLSGTGSSIPTARTSVTAWPPPPGPVKWPPSAPFTIPHQQGQAALRKSRAGPGLAHLKKTLPRYLDLEESVSLLDHVDGANQARDYCILTSVFKLRSADLELVGLNVTDVRGNQLRVLGKGNKERMLFSMRHVRMRWRTGSPSGACSPWWTRTPSL